MSQLKVSKLKLMREQQIQNQLQDEIDKWNSLIFRAGAGAGKTYALIECLKYVIKNKKDVLNDNNQKIICITYTNVATQEMKDRLGNTNLALISTIHERVWDFIKNYKSELLEIHREFVQSKIVDIEKEIAEFETSKNSFDQREKIFSIKESFYRYSHEKAADFRIKMEELDLPSELLKNVTTFKEYCKNIFRLYNYQKCIENIDDPEYPFELKTIEYTSTFNSDRLHKFKISHDTVLLYTEKMIHKYDYLKKIIIDRYPYIFVDEYQDTSEVVIQILKHLFEYSKEQNRRFFLGFYGDDAQNIYDEGIGKHIGKYFPLQVINKEFNRRSSEEIISLANRIRNDKNFVQETIFEEYHCDNPVFEVVRSNIQEKIDGLKKEWNITKDNKLHCFVLTNQTVAEYTGIEKIYIAFKNTDYYKNNWDQLGTELLSNELNKLGDVPLLFYRIMNLYLYKHSNDKILQQLTKRFKNMKVNDLREVLKELKQIGGETFDELVKSMIHLYNNTKNNILKACLRDVFAIENLSYTTFFDKLRSNLCDSALIDDTIDGTDKKSDEKTEESIAMINDLLTIPLDIYIKWYNYINNNFDKLDVVYHTYHGTKGLEFDNVLVIMNNHFNKKKDYFSLFFQGDSESLEEDEYNKRRNLLYVVTTRARKKLRLYYLDEITGLKDKIESIFGTIVT